jgi:DNA-binding MarR family transcriptional regulator
MQGGLVQRYIEGQRFLFLAEQCLNLTKKSLEPILRKFGLNHSQYLILMILNYANATGAQVISTELSYLLGREKHSITPLVQSLVANGLIVRGSDASDRRIIALSLTEKGKTLIQEVQPHTMQTIADIPLGSEKEKQSIFHVLESFRRLQAEKSGQNPELYSGAFNRLLVDGENKYFA